VTGALSLPPYILRIDCPDEPGLVHKITGVLFNAGYNILSNQEFVDLEGKNFFPLRWSRRAGTPKK
jgi:formyltetrahydrofolate deformylase